MASAKQDRLIQGGSLSRAPNGYLATIVTTGGAFPGPQVAQDLWSTVKRRRYPRAWNGLEPEGQLVIYWTPEPIRLVCARCRAGLGRYRAYRARGEYGIVQDTTRRYHPRENFPPDQFKNSPQDRLTPAEPRYWLAGNLVRASKAIAHFKCVNCGHQSERNLRRLGKELFEKRQAEHELD